MVTTGFILLINQKLPSENPLETPEGNHGPKMPFPIQVLRVQTEQFQKANARSEVIILVIQINPCKP